MKRFLLVLVVVLVGGAWLLGYWPQRGRVAALESELAGLRQRTATAEARARTGVLLAEVRNLEEAVMRQNFGDAQQISLAFFDHVRVDAGTTADPAMKQALEEVARHREPVTAALARADASVLATLRETEAVLRRALGYAVYGPNPAVPAAAGGASPIPSSPEVPTPAVSPATPLVTPSP
jgi:hypothetical protein